MTDEGVRTTNNDASHCKRWCVEKGYFKDDFLRHFVHSTAAKAPEISRGYYVRVQSVRQAVRSFLKENHCKCQIVNMGAGSDTLFWNLTQEGLQPLAFIELDFPQIVMKKIRTISSKSELNSVLSRDGGECDVTKVTLHSSRYHLLSVDLRDKAAVNKAVNTCPLDTSLPTLVLAECVLCYMSPASSAELLSWTSGTFPNSVFLNYEPCHMTDSAVFADESRFNALRFGGSLDDFISFQFDMSPFSESVTLCTWIKRVSTASSHPVVFEYHTGTNEILIGSDGRYNHVVRDGGLNSLQSKFTHPIGSWFHYCLSWSRASRTIRLYLDGHLIGSDQTDSGRTLTMGGTLWFNRVGYGHHQNHVFGGEIFQFNMYSDVLSASSIRRIAEGGLCYDLSEFDEIKALSWENIFAKSRTGEVRDILVCGWIKALYVKLSESEATLAKALKRLNVTEGHLREAEEKLQVMSSELNVTKLQLLEVKEDLNATESELDAVEGDLERTERVLLTERALHNRTEGLLQTERALHNRTKEQLETCSTSLAASDKRMKETRTLQNITKWDLLYTAPYFNQVFTEDHLEELSSSWDVLRRFVGLNMTKGVVEHFRRFHREPDCDSFAQLSAEMLFDFLDVDLSVGLIKHFQETHVESPCEEDTYS